MLVTQFVKAHKKYLDCHQHRERAIGKAQLGVTHDHIARTFACTRATITRLMGYFQQTGQTIDRARSGRLQVITPNEDCFLHILHLRNRFLSVTTLASTALGHHVSQQTVSRQIREHGARLGTSCVQ